MRTFVIAIIMFFLLGGFGATAYASYRGYGMLATGAPWVRVGSIGGPNIVGGGPGSGK
jgi:hypothetical protein